MVNETINQTIVIVAEKGMDFNQILDKILNVLIPIAVFVMFGFMIYKAFEEPFDRLFAWAANKWGGSDEPTQQNQPRNKGMIFDSRAEIYK